jgi:hypothetical protein
MSVFKSSRIFSATLSDVRPLAEAVAGHFTADGFETQIEPTLNGCLLSISKGGIFKAVCGLKTALNIEIEKLDGDRIQAEARVGIFGVQFVPSLIMLFAFAPILFTQIWGLIQQAELDDKAMLYIQDYLGSSGKEISTAPVCPQCKTALSATARFCPVCGTAVNVKAG